MKIINETRYPAIDFNGRQLTVMCTRWLSNDDSVYTTYRLELVIRVFTKAIIQIKTLLTSNHKSFEVLHINLHLVN